jgi:uncharacterized protein YecE (DUF72 family)
MTVHVGVSGWSYPHWRGRFYPPELPQRAQLSYLAQQMDTAEINASFYALQRPERYRNWAEQTPPGFLFAVKAGRYITHQKKLHDVQTALANFFASGPLVLGPKLGPVLWQLPATLAFDEVLLSAFLAQLPRTTAAAGELARQHDDRLNDRAWTQVDEDVALQHVLEVRDASYRNSRFYSLLRQYGIGLVVSDSPAWPRLEMVTSDVMYVRLHGATELYTSGYDGRALQGWARRAKRWQEAGLDVYFYFDNDSAVRAPTDALALRQILALSQA